MARVFVVQENPNVNILAAGHYGELIPLLKPGKQITLSSAPVVRLLKSKLKIIVIKILYLLWVIQLLLVSHV